LIFTGAPKSTSRDVGVECSVLTRDIGVSHQGPKIRSTSTQASEERPKIVPPPIAAKPDLKNNLSFSGVKHESISSAVVKKVESMNRAVNTDKIGVRDSESTTDLSMQQIYTEKQVEVMIDGHEKKLKREEEALKARLRVK